MKKIAVIGSGTMGNGIAHVFAQNDHEVSLIDISQDALEKALNTIFRNFDRQIKKELIDEAKKNKDDYRGKLAGQIDDETGYSDESRNKIVPYVSSALGLYNQAYEAYTKKKFEKQPEYIMSALWINHQKANEFNPPHDHDGKLSFVIYLKIGVWVSRTKFSYEKTFTGARILNISKHVIRAGVSFWKKKQVRRFWCWRCWWSSPSGS